MTSIFYRVQKHSAGGAMILPGVKQSPHWVTVSVRDNERDARDDWKAFSKSRGSLWRIVKVTKEVLK